MGRVLGARGARLRERLCALFFVVAAGLQSGPAFAQGASDAAAQALSLTQDAAALAVEHGAADAVRRDRVAEQLKSTLEERRALLQDLIETDPGAVLAARLPARYAAGLPQDLRALLERQGSAEGELTVIQVDHEDPGRSHLVYSLRTAAGERVALHFATHAPRLTTGEQVIARGLILDGAEGAEMALQSGEDDLQIAYCCTGGGSGGAASAPELPNTLGEQRTAVLLVNFADDPSNRPYTVAQAQEMVFSQVGGYFVEASHGQTWLTGDVYDWLTVASASSDVPCGSASLGTLVADAAPGAGIDLSLYQRLVYVTPTTACGFDGSATVGGAPSETWINGKYQFNIFAHEIGHNFGLVHSHSLSCGAVPLGENCQSLEYGDTVDVQGGAAAGGHFTAFQKLRLGWVTEGSGGEVATATSNGTYTLEPYETQPAASPKSLKIDAGLDPLSGAQRWLYLEYRQPIGYDAFLDVFSNNGVCRGVVTDGVYVHLGTEGDPDSSYLLHMKTDGCFAQTFGVLDWNDPALALGESYTVPDTGAVLTVDSVGPTGAVVTVGAGGAPVCTPAAPVVTVSALGDNWGAPGDTVSYEVSVTNADGAACGASAISLSTAAPSGWAASLADASLTLDPGQTGTTTLDLTSASSAADGAYDTVVTAANGADAGSDIATYIVQAPAANQAPVAMDDSATTTSGVEVTIPVLDNDYDPEGDALSVLVVGNPGKGTVALNTDGSITYTPGARAKGSDSFGYTLSDGLNTASATVSIAFTKSGDTSGGGGGGKGGGKGKP